MKRKDLYNYIRQEIINELTTVTKNTSSSDIADIAKAENVPTSTVTNAVNTAKKTGKDVNIAELARKGRNITAGENFAAIKNLYAGSMIERILDTIAGAGEEGITPKNIMTAVGIKFSSQLNPIMGELMELGAITGPAPKEAEAEPEKTAPEDDLAALGIPTVVDNPEDKEVDDDEFIEADKDEYEKPEEEEEMPDEEPQAADIQASEKELKKLTDIPAGKEEEVNKAINIIKSLSAKIQNLKVGSDEYKKKLAALKQYVANNKSLLRGVSLESITLGLLS